MSGFRAAVGDGERARLSPSSSRARSGSRRAASLGDFRAQLTDFLFDLVQRAFTCAA